MLDVDHVVLCAGQESVRACTTSCSRRPARRPGTCVHLVGGADVAAELDAKRAIEQGTRVAAGSDGVPGSAYAVYVLCSLTRSSTWTPRYKAVPARFDP